MHTRKGNAAIILILLVGVGAGAVAMSPDTAQDVLPGSLLVMLPQFEAVETDANCADIEKGTETVNKWVPEGFFGGEELDSSVVKEKICEVKCSQYQSMAGTYCSSEMLACACRIAGT